MPIPTSPAPQALERGEKIELLVVKTEDLDNQVRAACSAVAESRQLGFMLPFVVLLMDCFDFRLFCSIIRSPHHINFLSCFQSPTPPACRCRLYASRNRRRRSREQCMAALVLVLMLVLVMMIMMTLPSRFLFCFLPPF
jgi:hypothetical protein